MSEWRDGPQADVTTAIEMLKRADDEQRRARERAKR